MIDPILAAFDARLRRDPSAPIVVSTRRRATAGEVDDAARALAARLRERGLPGGGLVVLSAPNGPAFLAGLLAARRVELVPILCDATTPGVERSTAASALGACGELVAATGWPGALADWAIDVRPPERQVAPPAGSAVVKLTSGSTGTPRGIAVSAAALLADEAQLFASMGLADHGRYLAALPLSHSYGLSSLALPALVRDVTLIVPEDRSPLAPLAAAVAGEATFLPTVPAFLGALTRLADPPPCPPSVRLVISAGAVLPADVAARFRALFGLPVHVFYGASECGGICYDREGGAAERGSVGTPVEGVALALDEEDGRIEVRSPAVALGYFPVAAPELDGGRFRAGDLGFRRPDGELELRGRADDVLKIKGKNVNPREIEAVLAQLPGVSEVAVLGLPGSAASGPVLRAVLAADPATLSHERVREWCRAHLAEHKVPRSVLFVPELPRNARGKLDRAALTALVAGG